MVTSTSLLRSCTCSESGVRRPCLSRSLIWVTAQIILGSGCAAPQGRRTCRSTSNMAQENVWSYPRPPALEKVPQRLRVMLNGTELASTTQGYRVLETSHPPTVKLEELFLPTPIQPLLSHVPIPTYLLQSALSGELASAQLDCRIETNFFRLHAFFHPSSFNRHLIVNH